MNLGFTNPAWRIERNDLAIQLSNYFGRYFVSECKRNKNRFESLEAEDRMLLHNWASIPASAILRIDPSVSMPFSEIYCFGSRNNLKVDPSPAIGTKKLKRFPLR
jgi:hypothetical protein